MAEAVYRHEGCSIDITPSAAITAGEVIQLPDGRAAFAPAAIAASAMGSVTVSGVVRLAKTASVVILDGGEVRWDHSANTATFPVYTDDDDFPVGVAIGDSASATTTVDVALNVRSHGIVGIDRGGFDNIPVLTSGTPYGKQIGNALFAGFSATAEAQKEDFVSTRSFRVASEWIFEAVVTVTTNCDADVGDLSVGVANATHASDADSITESALFHYDMGADLNLDAESDDGTTEVAATDTTIDWAVGTPKHLVIDGRDSTDCLYYVDGVEVLNGTANLGDIQLATGPLKAMVHLEKSSNDSAGEIRVDKLEVRIAPEANA